MIRKLITYEDILSATQVMKGFEQVSTHVKVDIGYAAKCYFKMVSSGQAVYFALEKDNEIIGAMGAIKGPDLHKNRTVGIETFWFVHPLHRGGGLKLLDAFEEWGRTESCDALAMIHMVDSYPRALERLYRMRGYVLVEQHFVKELKP